MGFNDDVGIGRIGCASGNEVDDMERHGNSVSLLVAPSPKPPPSLRRRLPPSPPTPPRSVLSASFVPLPRSSHCVCYLSLARSILRLRSPSRSTRCNLYLTPLKTFLSGNFQKDLRKSSSIKLSGFRSDGGIFCYSNSCVLAVLQMFCSIIVLLTAVVGVVIVALFL
ncbi:hypothetical protein P8452_47103 [Trifolium repens]|nr:hypothetical protein P8452_47103 [Trifolium repens]